MDDNIVGKPHLKYVQDQIKTRQTILGKNQKSPQDIVWENGKSGWVRLASSVDIDNQEIPFYNTGSNEWEMVSDGGREYRESLLGQYIDRSRLVLEGGLSDKGLVYEENHRWGITNGPGAFNKHFNDYFTDTENGIWSDENYGFGGDYEFGLNPIPGILSFETKTNNNGSLRFATLTIKANSRRQFEWIETLYLRLGYTMLLEWGNSSYPILEGDDITYESNPYHLYKEFVLSQFTVPQEGVEGFDSRRENGALSRIDDYKAWARQEYFYSQIENFRRKSQGNYDGFLGKVENFSWEFQKDGTYLITLKLISIGSVVESLKININHNSILGKNLGSNKPQKAYQRQNSLLTMIHNATEPLITSETRDESWFTGMWTPGVMGSGAATAILSFIVDAETETTRTFKSRRSDYLVYEHIKNYANSSEVEVTEEMLENASNLVYACCGIFGDTHLVKYLRFGSLLEMLNENFLIYGDPTSDNEDGTPLLFALDTSSNQYGFSSKISMSSDPSKMIVRFGGNILGQDIKIFDEDEHQIEIFHTQTEGVDVCNIMNLYFSYAFLESIIVTNTDEETGALDLYKFLKSLLNEANILLGGVNKFNLRLVDKNFGSEDSPLVKSVVEFYDEVSPFEVDKLRKDNDEIPSLTLFGLPSKQGSFVTDYQFRTEITKDLATMIAVGAQANGQSVGEDATLLSRWNYGLVDLIMPAKVDKDKYIQKADEKAASYFNLISLYQDYISSFVKPQGTTTTITQETNNINITGQFLGGPYIDLIETSTGYGFKDCNITQPSGARNNSLIGFIETQKALFNTFYAFEAIGKKQSTPFIGFLPVGLTITMDGLSGIRIFDKLKVDSKFLPSNYGETLDFIITQLDHKIEGNKWYTTIGTQSIPKLFGDKLSLNFEELLRQFQPITTGFDNLVGNWSYDYSTLAELISRTVYRYNESEAGSTAAAVQGDRVTQAILNTNGNLSQPDWNEAGEYGIQNPVLISIGKIPRNASVNSTTGSPLGTLGYSSTFVLRNAVVYNGVDGESDDPDQSTIAFRLLNQQTNLDYYDGNYYLAEPAAEALLEFGKFLEREYPGKQFLITSAYRSRLHQSELSSTGVAASAGSSPHGWGGAIDIQELTTHDPDNDNKLTSDPALNQITRTTNLNYKIWAEHAPKFGWYNPLRLRDGVGQDESWHWEFWGVPGERIQVDAPFQPPSRRSISGDLLSVYNSVTGGTSVADVPTNNSLRFDNQVDVKLDENGQVIEYTPE